MQLHDNQEVVIEILSEADTMSANSEPMTLGGAAAHLRLLQHTRFAVAPRGTHAFSHYFVEAACAGAVPVIVSDTFVPPFSEAGGIDPTTFSVQVPESQWSMLPAILRAYSDETVCEMKRAAIDACEKHYGSLAAQLKSLLAILAQRKRQRVATDGPEVRPAVATPAWPTGPWRTFGCGERIGINSEQVTQSCYRCLAGADRGLPLCAVGEVMTTGAPAGGTLTEAALDPKLNVGRACVQQTGEYAGCECIQSASPLDDSFALWALSPKCDVQTLNRLYEISGLAETSPAPLVCTAAFSDERAAAVPCS